MSDYLDFSPGGVMTISKSGRKVLDTSGRLISRTPGATYGTDTSLANVTVTWPDFNKGWCHNWRAICTHLTGLNYQFNERGDYYFSALPQELAVDTILAAAPAGCNFVMGHLRLNRTTAPSHTWDTHTINMKPDSNVWIPFTSGSMIVEAQRGFIRTMSIYVDPLTHNLMLHQEQSVGAAPGYIANSIVDGSGKSMGYGVPPLPRGSTQTAFTQLEWGEWSYGSLAGAAVSACGSPIYNDFATMTVVHSAYTVAAPLSGQSPGQGSGFNRLVDGGTGAPAGGPDSTGIIADFTNYHSIYSLDLALQFGLAA